MNFPDALRNITLTLWVGGLWIVGAMVAPMLFHVLPNPLAGTVAGHLFVAMAWIGIVCGLYLLFHALFTTGFSGMKQGGFWIIVLMLLLTALNHFAIHPWITQLKQQAGNVAEGLFGGGFATAHAISSLIYFGECLLGLALVTKPN